MKAVRFQALAALALMLAAFAGAHAWRPTQLLSDTLPKVDLEAVFPNAFGDWAVDERMPVQIVSPDTQAALNRIYNQTLSRTYVNSRGDRIMLSVAYGGDQSDATSAHWPEGCYPGQGFEISSGVNGQLQTTMQPIRVRRLVAKLGARVEPITYWMVVGEKNIATNTEQKLAQLSYSTSGVVPDGTLVRISSIDPVPEHAYEVQRKFVDALMASMKPHERARIFGRARH